MKSKRYTSKHPKKQEEGVCAYLVSEDLRARRWDAGVADELQGRFREAGGSKGHHSELPPTSMLPAPWNRPGQCTSAEGARDPGHAASECILRTLSLHPCDFLVFANFFTFPHFSLKCFSNESHCRFIKMGKPPQNACLLDQA